MQVSAIIETGSENARTKYINLCGSKPKNYQDYEYSFVLVRVLGRFEAQPIQKWYIELIHNLQEKYIKSKHNNRPNLIIPNNRCHLHKAQKEKRSHLNELRDKNAGINRSRWQKACDKSIKKRAIFGLVNGVEK